MPKSMKRFRRRFNTGNTVKHVVHGIGTLLAPVLGARYPGEYYIVRWDSGSYDTVSANTLTSVPNRNRESI